MVDNSGRQNKRDSGGSKTRGSSSSEMRDEVMLVWYEHGQRQYGRTSLHSSWKSVDRGGGRWWWQDKISLHSSCMSVGRKGG